MIDWMISIQKMIRTTLSVRVSDFVTTSDMPKNSAAAEHDQMSLFHRAHAGADDDDDPDQAEHDRGEPRPS